MEQELGGPGPPFTEMMSSSKRWCQRAIKSWGGGGASTPDASVLCCDGGGLENTEKQNQAAAVSLRVHMVRVCLGIPENPALQFHLSQSDTLKCPVLLKWGRLPGCAGAGGAPMQQSIPPADMPLRGLLPVHTLMGASPAARAPRGAGSLMLGTTGPWAAPSLGPGRPVDRRG